MTESKSFRVLASNGQAWKKTEEERALMTIACNDAEIIPRVKNAGDIINKNGKSYQVMHNGLMVEANGYQGNWQAKTIKALKGVHEPQEERVFYEVLKRIKNPSFMIELGSWWSYYTMWFLKDFPLANAICTEPDPVNIELGKRNMSFNGLDSRVKFFPTVTGKPGQKSVKFINEDKTILKVPTKSIDLMIEEEAVKKVDILHMDIQGAELDALKGAERSIASGKIRFLFVSTHHYLISQNPLIHEECIDFIKQHGGHIVAEHTVLESCSGDGLIVASFDKQDAGFVVDISLQRTKDSLFRSSEEDVAVLWREYDKKVAELEKHILNQQGTIKEMDAIINAKDELISKKDALINEIVPLRKHIKRQVRQRIRKK